MVTRTGHRRYRELCDPRHPDYDRAYESIVLRMAQGLPAHPVRSEPAPEPARPRSPAPPPPRPVEFPSPLRQAANFLGAGAAHLAAGLPETPPAIAAKRLTICRGCDRFIGDRCSLCGCVAEVKIRWAEQQCPAGKW